jgi:hypothetical protein
VHDVWREYKVNVVSFYQWFSLSLIYHISKNECWGSIWRTVQGIVTCPELAFRPPKSEQDFKNLEIELSKAHNRRYPGTCESWFGQIGAIDGIDISMRNPDKAVPGGPARYFVDRKGGYMLLATAICDAHRRFWFMDISMESQTHDSLAWSSTPLGALYNEGMVAHLDSSYVATTRTTAARTWWLVLSSGFNQLFLKRLWHCDEILTAMRDHTAPGDDGIPAEVYKAIIDCPSMIKDFEEIIEQFWKSGSYNPDVENLENHLSSTLINSVTYRTDG